MSVKEQVLVRGKWIRGLYMLVFAFIYGLAELVIAAVVIIQFVLVLFTGKANERLLGFGRDLGRYVYQVILYLTYNNEEKPFPFNDWTHDQDW